MEKMSVVIQNQTGLHARPVQLFIKTANKFKSDIFIIKNDNKVNAKSIINILASGIGKGTEIIIEANGPDEQDALRELVDLVKNKFGEE